MSDGVTDVEAMGGPEPGGPSRRGLQRLRIVWVIAGLAFATLIGVGYHVWTQVSPLISAPYRQVDYVVPAAPRLVAGNDETVYRIDPTQSEASYAVDEKIAGATADRVTGVTNGIAGDLAVNGRQPSASRVGEIVINLEELHSGNNLRDARLRAAYLGSHAYPLARFTATAVSGLPASMQDGRTYSFTMSGDLSVKTTTAPVTWQAQATLSNGKLTATATTTIKQSKFGIGPISVAGLVSTSDRVDLTLKLVALDPSRYRVPTQIAAPAQARHAGSSPSFAAAIKPVLEQDCASCHNPGQIGAAHWELRTASDAAAVADGLRVVTQSRFMPPWPPSPAGVALAHSKALDPRTIDLIRRWADAGGKLDVPPSMPINAAPGAGGPHPRRDVVLTMSAPYLGSLDVPNDYRCFVLDPHFTQPTYVTGYSFEAQQISEIHHAQIFHVGADQAAANKALEGGDGNPGWRCYGGPDVGRVGDTAGGRFTGEPGLVAGWAPGQDPVIYPDNAGVLMQPGDVLVLQIHYHYDRAPIPDQSTVTMQTEPGTAGVRPILIVNPLAPVEIPCMPDVTGPLCDRRAALASDYHLYGETGLAELALLPLCNHTQAELTAGFDGIAHSSCDLPVPQSGQIIAVFGHMHTLGKSVRLVLDPNTPQEKVLLDIPTWNFDWQMNYALVTPLHVTANDVVQLQCTWDRSLDPNRAPKYMVFAEGTEDEMCFGTYALIPDQ